MISERQKRMNDAYIEMDQNTKQSSCHVVGVLASHPRFQELDDLRVTFSLCDIERVKDLCIFEWAIQHR